MHKSVLGRIAEVTTPAGNKYKGKVSVLDSNSLTLVLTKARSLDSSQNYSVLIFRALDVDKLRLEAQDSAVIYKKPHN